MFLNKMLSFNPFISFMLIQMFFMILLGIFTVLYKIYNNEKLSSLMIFWKCFIMPLTVTLIGLGVKFIFNLEWSFILPVILAGEEVVLALSSHSSPLSVSSPSEPILLKVSETFIPKSKTVSFIDMSNMTTINMDDIKISNFNQKQKASLVELCPIGTDSDSEVSSITAEKLRFAIRMLRMHHSWYLKQLCICGTCGVLVGVPLTILATWYLDDYISSLI